MCVVTLIIATVAAVVHNDRYLSIDMFAVDDVDSLAALKANHGLLDRDGSHCSHFGKSQDAANVNRFVCRSS